MAHLDFIPSVFRVMDSEGKCFRLSHGSIRDTRRGIPILDQPVTQGEREEFIFLGGWPGQRPRIHSHTRWCHNIGWIGGQRRRRWPRFGQCCATITPAWADAMGDGKKTVCLPGVDEHVSSLYFSLLVTLYGPWGTGEQHTKLTLPSRKWTF